ncbi:hypothetical protein niasHT_021090 [Heterodera trifolii]|uniref:PAN domain-containing protein n=1 Tax=Heterodera trifolii TaxID=157864 RepID=A0ABD2KD74_9BILA
MPNNGPIRHFSITHFLLLHFLFITTALMLIPLLSAAVADGTAQLRISIDHQQRHLLEIGTAGVTNAIPDQNDGQNVESVGATTTDSSVLGDKDTMEQCPSPKDTSFFIEHLRPFVGQKIGKSPPMDIPSVDECAKRCFKVANCAGANFMLAFDGEPICTLHSSATLGAEAESPLEPMFGMSRFCLRRDPFDPATQLCSAPWTFQKFAKIRPVEMSAEFLVQNWDGNGGDGNLSSIYSLDECLQECHRNPNCAGALYSSRGRACHLSKISPQNVHGFRQHFTHDAEWDLYELNCVRGPLNPSRCAFHRIRQAGFTSPFTALLHGVMTPEECQSVCVAFLHALSAHQSRQTTTICRAWTHNANSSKCFLNHLALRSLGRNVLERIEPGLSSGEVDECMDFKLDCHLNSLTLSGFSPLKLFRGHVVPKRRTTPPVPMPSAAAGPSGGADADECMRRVSAPVHAFRVRLPLAQCAFETDNRQGARRRHTNTLMVKEASTALITARDKTVQVNCYVRRRSFGTVDDAMAPNYFAKNETENKKEGEKDQQQVGAVPSTHENPHQMVSTRVLLKKPPQLRPSDQIGPTATKTKQHQQRLSGPTAAGAYHWRQNEPGPAYRLEVLDAFGMPVQKVELGMPGFLEIRRRHRRTFPHNYANDEDGSLLISDLKAINSENEEATNSVALIDANGCVTNLSMVTSIQQMGPNRLRIGIRFVPFGDKVRVAYQAVVKRCQFGCRLDCNRHFYIGTDSGGQQQRTVEMEADEEPLNYDGLEEEDEAVDSDGKSGPKLTANENGALPDQFDVSIHRIRRRAIAMPTTERTIRHFQLEDELWEVRTHGIETVERAENDEQKMFAVRLRDLNVLAATLLAVLLLTSAYLACIIINLWLLNIHLSVAHCLHRFIALFAHFQQHEPSAQSPASAPSPPSADSVPKSCQCQQNLRRISWHQTEAAKNTNTSREIDERNKRRSGSFSYRHFRTAVFVPPFSYRDVFVPSVFVPGSFSYRHFRTGDIFVRVLVQASDSIRKT